MRWKIFTEATTPALSYLGLAGEKGAAKAQAPGSFQRSLLDALFTIDEEQLKDGARIQDSASGSI